MLRDFDLAEAPAARSCRGGLGRFGEAVGAHDRALALGPNRSERAFLEGRRRETIGAATAG